MQDRTLVSTGTPWEAEVGYSRAVRVGNQVFVSGTTASNSAGETEAVGDPYGQAIYVLKKIETSLREVGAEMTDVVRTRMFVTDISRWEQVGKAHGEVFRDIRPVSTMVEVNGLVSPDHLVEIEVDAIISAASSAG